MATTLSPWPERLSSNKKRVIQRLVHGQECATHLQGLFRKSSKEGVGLSAEELVQEILGSFNDTISALSSSESAEVVSQNQVASNDESPCSDDRKSEDSSESRKRPASKDKRGCYKRKRTAQTWTEVSSTMDDGHAWRKYGQKEILNSKHPRSYFRCTRKYDQGCKATKQVQRMEDDSHMFQTTYIGNHTCRDSLKAPQMITADSEPWKEPHIGNSKIIISSKQHHPHQEHPHLSSTTVKQESREEPTPSDLTDLDSIIMWKDIIAEPGMESDYRDVYNSCNEISSRSFEMDFGMKHVEFDGDGFPFDESTFV